MFDMLDKEKICFENRLIVGVTAVTRFCAMYIQQCLIVQLLIDLVFIVSLT